MVRRIALLVLAIGLAGCATAAQREAQQSAAGVSAASMNAKACGQALYNQPRFAPLRSHLPDISTGQFTIEQLADTAVPSPSEAALMAEYYDAGAPCRAALISGIDSVRPDLAVVVAQDLAASSRIAVALAERRISWGEAAREKQTPTTETQAKLVSVNQQWAAALNAENQAELDRRQAAAAALLQYGAEQQAISAAERPIVTTCGQSGTTVNCVSR